MMPKFKSCLIGLTMLAGTGAVAQTPAALKVGDTIYEVAGGEIGKVTATTTDSVIVDTGAHKVTLPSSSIGAGAKGPVLASTKAQVDAFAQQVDDAAKAALTAALKPGASVTGVNGTPVGTVKSVEAGLVEITTPKGPVKLPQTAFVAQGNSLKIGMTAAEFDAAVTAATKPG
jgi:preprotein translocase subunit YajC